MGIRTYLEFIPRIDPLCYVDRTAEIIGNVSAASGSSFWPYSVVRGDVQAITIGKNVNIQDHSMLHVTHDSKYNPGGHSLSIGDDVTIGHHVTLHGCTINNACLIGIGSIVLDNAVLEQHIYLAAGSLVPPNKVLSSGYLYLGNPVRQHRLLNDDEIEFIYYSAKKYTELANSYK